MTFALNISTQEVQSKTGKTRKHHSVVLKQDGKEKLHYSFNSMKQAKAKYEHLKKLFVE